ncbi:MAG: hypothetical protein KAI73_12155 [Rhodospirillaceae bacterium]|nr:hypothetical protein [Rhodospirillaceae bacterium]
MIGKGGEITEIKTERDLCAVFMAEVRGKYGDNKWTVYPETGGFDILLVRNDGFQIGIEAKLRLNAKVVSQALPARWYPSQGDNIGPDCRAVLVPAEGRINADFIKICECLGITVLLCRVIPENERRWRRFNHAIQPELPSDAQWLYRDEWFECCPDKRITLPEFVPDCDAGCPSPLMLTPWKIKAIKIIVLLKKYGSVSRQDFKELKIDAGRWTQGTGWLALSEKRGIYVEGEQLPNLAFQHPKNYDEIEAAIDDWLPENRRPLPLEVKP